MLESLKDKTEALCEGWLAEIDKTKGTTEIDISKEFIKLFGKNIIHIAFGEDIADHKLKIMVEKDLNGISPMVEKELTLVECFDEIFDQLMTGIIPKLINPLYRFIFEATGKSVSFTAYERVVDQNCRVLRGYIHDYIQKRKTGKARSTVRKDADLLTLFFQNPEIFTDEFIVDELMDFFTAAT